MRWVSVMLVVGCASSEASGGGDATAGPSGPDVGAADAADDTRGAADLEAPPEDAADQPLPPAPVSGTVRIFGPPGGPLEGAKISILEHPELTASTDAAGEYRFEAVPAGDVTLVMAAEGYPENQLGTLTSNGAALTGCDFQAVSHGIYDLFALLTESEPDPARCQISTTVTRFFEGDLPVVHGEPGATAVTVPEIPTAPIYFNADVLPTPGLDETTVDGGVVWTNVTPGDYVLEARKEGVQFSPVRIKCRAGVLVNAAPPRGIQGLNPGSGYSE